MVSVTVYFQQVTGHQAGGEEQYKFAEKFQQKHDHAESMMRGLGGCRQGIKEQKGMPAGCKDPAGHWE
jgi:hypothetical protein